ncbi:hypothetical protein F2Q70_00017187 [Brassica cretica]|uniref:Uncharacterized protein n=1 Tax=Brassica cretica TaxID=69181 RepID=A0A8S9HZS7_BRACR|nr:hypothetical protein F2Q70_00017187 [Brassica cretica]
MIYVFVEQEKLHEAEATNLRERFRASFDPYGSNVDLIGPDTASQLITSREIVEEPFEEPTVDITSAPTEHAAGPEKDALEESPEKDNLEENPEKGNPETDGVLIREGRTENVGIEDPVLAYDTSSEGREDEEEEGDRAKKTPSDTCNSRNSAEDRNDALIGSERDGSEASSQVLRLLRRVRRRVRFDQIDCRPTIYHPGGIFEELSPLPLRHPNTIAYPEKFFESAQAIATHSHLRWPDLS